MKINAPNKGIRTVAKLYSNNLYGKQAASTISSYKVAMLKPNGVVGFFTVTENEKTPGYIACGAAITSYARNFTITAAQKITTVSINPDLYMRTRIACISIYR